MWDFLVFIYINWISMCLPHSANRKLQRRGGVGQVAFTLPYSPSSSPLIPLPNTLPPLSVAEEAKRKRRQKGNMYVIYHSLCQLSFISFRMFLCLSICRANKGLNKLINIVLLVCKGVAQRECTSIIKQFNFILG